MSLYINGTNVSPQSTPSTSFQGIGVDQGSVYAVGSNGKLYMGDTRVQNPAWYVVSVNSIPMPCTGIGIYNTSVYAVGSNGKLYFCSTTGQTNNWYVITSTTSIS